MACCFLSEKEHETGEKYIVILFAPSFFGYLVSSYVKSRNNLPVTRKGIIVIAAAIILNSTGQVLFWDSLNVFICFKKEKWHNNTPVGLMPACMKCYSNMKYASLKYLLSVIRI